MQPMQGMAGQFEAKYPGVKVSITRIVGAAQYQRYLQETQAGQYIVDVLHIGDEPSMADLVKKGSIVDWKVPTLNRVPPSSRIKTNAYTSYIIDDSIAYNPNKVSPEEVAILGRDWTGILDPRFKGRIAITDQRAGGNIAAIEMFLDPKYKDRFGLKYLQTLAAQHLVIYNDVQVPVDRVIAGENDIAIWPSEGTMMVQYRQGAPIRWLHVKPTPAFGNTWFGISKYTPHPYAARLFLNWVMSDDGANAVETKYGGIPTLEGVKDERPVTRESWYVPITDVYNIDWNRWITDSVGDYTNWINLMKSAR
jgi:iron(III) transport system substrate-binding protein